MVFLKLIRKDGLKTIHETLDIQDITGTDKVMIYEGCFNESEAVAVTQEDLQFLWERKKFKKPLDIIKGAKYV